jgi:enoyl-CoA hydratase/carnithine racemase
MGARHPFYNLESAKLYHCPTKNKKKPTTMLRSLARSTRPLTARVSSSTRQLSSTTSSEKLSDNFTLEITQDGIAVFTLDMPGAPVNMLSSSLSDDIEPMLNRIETDHTIKAAVIRSGKKGVWVAGADINELKACTTAAQATELSAAGQSNLAKIENCSKPIVAAINGACLGGGLELAMACHYRVASTDSKCKLGLVEVQLGLLPGAGGTQRLQKLVGIQEALKMTTTGGQVKADKAKRSGLVDVVADPFALDHAAQLCALQLANGT